MSCLSVPRLGPALVGAGLLVLLAGCSGSPAQQIDAATDSAVRMSVRSLPGVTDATVTEAAGPPDTMLVSLTTAFDATSGDDAATATELVGEAAKMVYATRHDTVDSLTVAVSGITPDAPSVLMTQSTFSKAQLAVLP